MTCPCSQTLVRARYTWLNDLLVLGVEYNPLGGVFFDANGRRSWKTGQHLSEGVAFKLWPLLQVELITCSVTHGGCNT